LDSIKNGENPTGFMGEPYEPQKVQMWIEEANEILDESLEKIAYYDALIQESGGIIDKDSISPGDIVKISRYGNTDVRVIRKGSKNITFEFLEPHMKIADGTQMQGKASYAVILEIVKSS
jgi:DNA-directed RNA polymerase subunit H (RpoH/RPB5)